METSAAWYGSVLGMVRHDSQSDRGEIRTMKINLRPVSASQEAWFMARAAVAGRQDLCFFTNVVPPDVVAHLRASGVEIVLGPITKSGARGQICSVYEHDPDGNLIEISSYP